MNATLILDDFEIMTIKLQIVTKIVAKLESLEPPKNINRHRY